LSFEKREIILILGILFLMIGMMPFIAPIYAVTIAIVIYFGVRVIVGRRKKQIRESIGEGVCAVCGQRIIDKKCTICDKPNDSGAA
jgi:phosphate/sulfate permease